MNAVITFLCPWTDFNLRLKNSTGLSTQFRWFVSKWRCNLFCFIDSVERTLRLTTHFGSPSNSVKTSLKASLHDRFAISRLKLSNKKDSLSKTQYQQKTVKTACTTKLFNAWKELAGVKPKLLTIVLCQKCNKHWLLPAFLNNALSTRSASRLCIFCLQKICVLLFKSLQRLFLFWILSLWRCLQETSCPEELSGDPTLGRDP